MTVLVTTVLLLLFLGYYLTFLWNVRKGLMSTTIPSSSITPFVSVIVAARNEEDNIQQCVHALTQQSYDPKEYEIIVVDDNSQDRTREFANKVVARDNPPNTIVLSLLEHKGLHGKPAAIALGIEKSGGDIILCTDADCTVPSGWIASMVRCFEPSIAFVAGPVLEQPSGSFLSHIESLEFLGLITTGAGLIGSGTPIICNGANIAYRRAAFQQVNGYGNGPGSCDDETLMQRIVTRRVGRVVFNVDPRAIVTTLTPPTLRAFWRQRTRWAAKRGHYEDRSILLRLLLLYGFFLVLFLSTLLAVLEPAMSFPLLIVVLLKMLGEWSVLTKGSLLFQQRVFPGRFLIAELFHVPYIVFAALIAQFSSLRWKNRKLER
jgi:biofilm PGA synthesis N-glycosyltransferase PgaC